MNHFDAKKPAIIDRMVELCEDGALVHWKQFGENLHSEDIEDEMHVTITGKDGHKDNDNGATVFSFSLSGITNPLWRFYFYDPKPDIKIHIGGSTMELTCYASELKANYTTAKKMIEKANIEYREEIDRLKKVGSINHERFEKERKVARDEKSRIETEKNAAESALEDLEL